ncbi:hypothetical protein [Bdellovibrio bacteriovorus]|uniref:Transglycosylase SLT domain-containing protein n=1 Tax=Bdellovibrio bacteriovorus str. Tiberius TaxID=1069642 RepID=K7YXD0_BDEBC|nr:hypothetical protein [Bdellovibrio bacteriovorus]AFY02338.1 hypothetical protein Bdt_2656 [Bdellovibrio bacteriovorus str. Tiberius]
MIVQRSRTSFWFYTFCCLASFTAFGWYEITRPTAGAGDYASSAEEQVIKKLQTVNKSLTGIGTTAAKDDMTCTCNFGDVENMITFEKPENCGPERNYLQKQFEAFKKADPKGLFAGGRDYSKTADILPRKCALYIMKRFWKDRALTPEEKREADIEFNRTAPPTNQREVKDVKDYKKDPWLFAKCDQDTGTPERYGHKACVTENYVNLVYNSLIDVADCLEVPAKFIAPKLSNESGLHVNAFGLVNDGGIGQFTDQALADVAQNFENFKGRINNSTKASCQRLRSIPGAVPAKAEEILSEDSQRCHAISTPPNPLRSMVYYGIFYHATKRNSNGAWNRSTDAKNPDFKGVEQLMKDAGIDGFDKESIKEMIFVMAYNSGPGRPPVFYREWLKYRITTLKKYPITKADFDMNYWPTGAQLKAKAGEARAKAIGKKTPLTLAEYLFAYKDSLYIPAVKAQARVLDKALGAGTCTENKFLEL